MNTAIYSNHTQTPPGPRGLPYVGNLPAMQRDILGFTLMARREYGDVVRVRTIGNNAWYLISHPDDIERVLRNRNYPKGPIGQGLYRLIGNGLLLSEGDFWLRQRRLAQPAFHRQRLINLAAMMTAKAELVAERWQALAAQHQPFNVTHEMMRLTLQIVGLALFNSDLSSAAGDVDHALTVALEDINYRSYHPFVLPDRYPTPRNRRFRQARATIDRLMYQLIEEHRRAGTDVGDLLSMLLAARDEETGAGMSDEQLRDEVATLVLAGHETTANALSWTWYLLAQHPLIAQKLHAELDSVLAGRSPTFEDLTNLPYNRMVIEEALRLYPPAWSTGRQIQHDEELHGYTVPAQSVVIIAQWVTHRHPAFWDDPERFDPERFTPERSAGRHKFAYFPFGGGPRQCIGNSFAMMEAQLILATLAQRYRLDLVQAQRVAPEPTVTLRPKYGICVTAQRRQPR